MYSTFHSFTAGKMLYNEVSQLSLLWFTFLLTQHPFKTDAFSFLGLLHMSPIYWAGPGSY